jgi:glycerol-3-phosphate acyltransferase PlsY
MAASSPTVLLLALAGYLLGSIPFGWMLAKLLGGRDVREHGSGNIGATNVSRVAGPAAGILTLVLDAGKGAAAVWLGARFASHSAAAMMIAGIAALLGHCFPAWLGFRGGKGVATALGVFAWLCPVAAVVGVVLFALVFVFWRYVSLASVCVAAAMPLLVYFLWAPGHAPPLTIVMGTLFSALLIFYQHRANLHRLVQGTEPRYQMAKRKAQSDE